LPADLRLSAEQSPQHSSDNPARHPVLNAPPETPAAEGLKVAQKARNGVKNRTDRRKIHHG
jgi:hypothetical protein